MAFLSSSLSDNNLDTSCLSRDEAVSGEAGGMYSVPTGIRAVIMRDRLQTETWKQQQQLVNTGCLQNMNENLIESMNNSIQFGLQRARLAKPLG
jgi:hypothetical protein